MFNANISSAFIVAHLQLQRIIYYTESFSTVYYKILNDVLVLVDQSRVRTFYIYFKHRLHKLSFSKYTVCKIYLFLISKGSGIISLIRQLLGSLLLLLKTFYLQLLSNKSSTGLDVYFLSIMLFTVNTLLLRSII